MQQVHQPTKPSLQAARRQVAMQPERAPAAAVPEGGGLTHPQLSYSKTHDGGELCGDKNMYVSVTVGECQPLQLSHLAPLLRR